MSYELKKSTEEFPLPTLLPYGTLKSELSASFLKIHSLAKLTIQNIFSVCYVNFFMYVYAHVPRLILALNSLQFVIYNLIYSLFSFNWY